MTPVVNSYFSGAGLMDIGLQEAGLQLQQSFELDSACIQTARTNFKHQIYQRDIREKRVADEKPCDVMIATYPCNRYAEIGHLHGVCTGDDLYLHFFRHLAIRKPELYALENVPGMRKFPVVMEAMTRLPDYYVTSFCPVKSELWLPQKRDRLIIIGSKRHFFWREPSCSRPVRTKQILECDPQVEIPSYVLKRLRGGYRDKPIITDPAAGDLAPTCVAHYAKDRSTRLVKDRRFPRGVRPWTVREYARLQGMPDWFQFVGSDSDAYRMIGNGVSIPVARWLGKEILRYFN